VLILTGGRVVDVTAGESFPADVAVEDGRIRAVCPGLGEEHPQAEKIDVTGKYILPGLIDAHVHLGGSAGVGSPEEFSPEQFELNLRGYLCCGVTAVLDMGGMWDLLLHWRELILEGELLSPRLFGVGPGLTAPRGHPVSTVFKDFPPELVDRLARQVDDPQAAREEVARLAELGVDAIKAIYDDAGGRLPKLPRPVLAALIEEAHRQGLKAFVHVGTIADAREAVELGADGIEHLPTEGNPGALEKLFRAMAHLGTFCTPTLAVYEALFRIASGDDFEDLEGTVGVPRAVLQGLRRREVRERFQGRRNGFERRLESALANTRLAHRMGVRLVAGTDAGNPATFHGFSLHRELSLLLAAGLSPQEAIRCATLGAAEKLGRPELGEVAPGKAADLVVVAGDPLEDMGALRRIELVVAAGVPHRPEEFSGKGGEQDGT
jgi:imidazolonepropionase-like amidohydrolase